MTTTHKAMPVSGYTPQSQEAIDLANEGKAIEEQYLRWLDKLASDSNCDPRHVALARTNIQQGAMWAIRSIFQPKRVPLPGDAP